MRWFTPSGFGFDQFQLKYLKNSEKCQRNINNSSGLTKTLSSRLHRMTIGTFILKSKTEENKMKCRL